MPEASCGEQQEESRSHVPRPGVSPGVPSVEPMLLQDPLKQWVPLLVGTVPSTPLSGASPF